MRQAAGPDEAPTHNRRSDLQESNVVALGHDVVLFMDDNLLHISLLQRLFHWLVSSIFNFLGSKNQSPVIDFFFVVEAVSSCKHPVGVEQAASTGMVPAAVMGHEDL